MPTDWLQFKTQIKLSSWEREKLLKMELIKNWWKKESIFIDWRKEIDLSTFHIKKPEIMYHLSCEILFTFCFLQNLNKHCQNINSTSEISRFRLKLNINRPFNGKYHQTQTAKFCRVTCGRKFQETAWSHRSDDQIAIEKWNLIFFVYG